MRTLHRPLTAVVLSAFLSVGMWVGAASSASGNTSAFDQGMVISDQKFYDSGALNEQQIKSLLTDKGRNCRSSGSQTCLKDMTIPATTLLSDQKGAGCNNLSIGAGSRAWTVINQVAKACSISPKVLLTTIQKESSGVTQPLSTSRWNKMMGMGCPDGGSCASKYSGFTKQLYYSADSLRSYRSRTSHTAIKAFTNQTPYRTLDGQTFVIKNIATASLYTYTPHVSSNRLFAQIWNGFFSDKLNGSSSSAAGTAAAPATAVSVASAVRKPVNQSTYAWGTASGFPSGTSVKVSTQVLVKGRWSTSQIRTANGSGGYTIPLTYGSNTPGNYTFRTVASGAGKTATSSQFTLTRTR
ncbi:MAG TPA: hypothetical protein PKE40_13205 [Arachnia sp.]|nr:hypothetical protein [Arachnia sp.]HMT87303.1 hypothetical protein [Arachnia sp.]